MNINWKLRLQNKVTLTALCVQVIAIVYAACTLAGLTPAIGESQLVNLCGMVIELLVLVGIVVDPTTDGLGDSDLALGYPEPKK